MGWNKREPVSNLTMLGDAEGQIESCGGLLVEIHPDPNPKFKNFIYELVQKNGESINLAGSASLTRQINDTDIGHFVKCEFEGWGDSPNGKFKKIKVEIYEGDPTPAMKTWPRWAESQPAPVKSISKVKAKPADDFEDAAPKVVADDSDDLPF